MCEPTALAVSAVVLSVAGSGLSAYSQYQAGQYNSELMENNAILARRAAVDAAQRGQGEGSRALMAGSRVIGTGRAIAGHSGVDVQSESVLDSIGTTRAVSALDAETIRTNALREALGLSTQASNFEAQGRLAEYQAAFGATSTLISGAASAMGTGYQTNLFPRLGRA